MENKWCPSCTCKASRVLYMGFPMYLCDTCYTLWGFWSFLPGAFPISSGGFFMFIEYEGSYLGALWDFIKAGVK